MGSFKKASHYQPTAQMISTAVCNRWLDSCCLSMISRFRKKKNTHVGLLDYYTLLYTAGITGEAGEHFPHKNGPLCTVSCAPFPKTTKRF
jgi:hypothetical protein